MKLNTRNVTIHHTGFHRSTEAFDYGQRTLLVTMGEGENDPAYFAEGAFHDTNSPGAHANEISRNGGRCYSMSTGDIAEVQGAAKFASPTFLLCKGCGFEAISRGEFYWLLLLQKVEQTKNPDKRWSMDFDGVRALGKRRALMAALEASK